jgi:tetratricopeptide (TPR) repeat protein
LADTYLLLNESKAGTEAREALKFDPLLAEAHASLGLIAMNQDWDWAGSQREFQRALQFNSNYATAHHWYAEFLTAQGRFDEALTEIDRARELDPLSRIIATDSGKFLYYARRYPQAIDRLRKVLAEDPGFDEARFYLAEAYLSAGRFEEALAELDAVHDPSRTDLLDVKAAVLARMGRLAEAEDVVSGLVARRLSTYGLIALGQQEAALADMEAAIRVRSTFVTSMRVHPLLDPLRGNPRFQAMLHHVGLDMAR